jgi:hypothetical protein
MISRISRISTQGIRIFPEISSTPISEKSRRVPELLELRGDNQV